MQQLIVSRQIHELLTGRPRFDATFQPADLPKNGIYFFYEKGEVSGSDEADCSRIVRVGTHIGDDRLAKRLKLHYQGRARKSVFRRNVGYAMVLAGELSDAVPVDLNSFAPELEANISRRFAEWFRFSVVRVDSVEDRLRLEAGLIASLAAEPKPAPSTGWLGHHSLVEAMRKSGLWNRNHVNGAPLSATDFDLLRQQV